MRAAHALERMQLIMRAVRGDGELRISFHKEGEPDLLVGNIAREDHLRWWITSLMQVLKGCATDPKSRHPSEAAPRESNIFISREESRR